MPINLNNYLAGYPAGLDYANQQYNVELDPNTGRLVGRKAGKYMPALGQQWSEFDPSSSGFNAAKFARDFGLPASSPTGDLIFSNNTTFGNVANAIKKSYGVDFSQFLAMSPDQRQSLFTKKKQGYMSSLFDPVTGLPTRPPKTQEEAIEFQWKADEYARKYQERNMANALATLRYSLGQVSRTSPFSLATMMSPIFGNIAQTYNSYQPVSPDYSAFFRPDILAQSPSAAYGGYVDPLGRR
jgi:hypothetical protein